MKAILVGGPLDGQTVQVSNAQANYISSQKNDNYVKAMTTDDFAIFVTSSVPQDAMIPLLAKKIAEAYSLHNAAGMALTQLDDAMMYVNGGSLITAEKAIKRAQEILTDGGQ